MTQKQWYIAGAVALVIVLVIIAYFALRKHGDTTTSGSSMLGSSSAICGYTKGTPIPTPFSCTPPQVCYKQACVTPLNYPTGASCTNPWDCTSMACARGTAASGAPMVCCAKSSEEYAGYEYCQGMVPGSTCWSDAMCASGDCKGNEGGLKKGTCA